MSFAENLQYLRKRNDITQEQLAERLEVSRQSVSKWESAQSYPEMEKLLQICQMFHCSMDDLLQGDVSRGFAEDSCGYDRFMNQFGRWITLGVSLILFGISIAAMLEGRGVEENICGAVFFALMIVAVMIFIVMGMQYARFQEKNPQIEDFYTEEEKEQAYRKFTVRIASGVGIILVAVLFLIVVAESVENRYTDPVLAERAEDMLMGFFMLAITLAVALLVYGGMQKSKYAVKEYNKEANPSPERKKRNALKSKICGCIMLLSTIVYFILNFCVELWARAWVVFIVGGILCGITAIVLSREDE